MSTHRQRLARLVAQRTGVPYAKALSQVRELGEAHALPVQLDDLGQAADQVIAQLGSPIALASPMVVAEPDDSGVFVLADEHCAGVSWIRAFSADPVASSLLEQYRPKMEGERPDGSFVLDDPMVRTGPAYDAALDQALAAQVRAILGAWADDQRPRDWPAGSVSACAPQGLDSFPMYDGGNCTETEIVVRIYGHDAPVEPGARAEQSYPAGNDSHNSVMERSAVKALVQGFRAWLVAAGCPARAVVVHSSAPSTVVTL